MSYPQGIDISQYQATTPSLAGLAFVFARASIGLGADTMYVTHRDHVKAAGLVMGAYHFGTNADPAQQARVFLASATGANLFVLDLEGSDSPMTNAQAQTFIAAVKSAGHTCGLYHSESGYPELGQDFDWVAHWGVATPTRHWTFHQFRGSPLDLDQFNGTQDQLLQLAGLSPHIPTKVVISPPGVDIYDVHGHPSLGHVSKATYAVGPRIKVNGAWQYPIKAHGGWYVRPSRYAQFS